MKQLFIKLIAVVFLLIPVSGFSIVFVTIDDKGNHYYSCEGTAGHVIAVKQISKNRYKALGDTIGKLFTANSESEVALIVCGEASPSKSSKPGNSNQN